MSKKIAGVTLEQVSNESLWVVKHEGWRECDTYPNLEKRGSLNADDIRDVDLLYYEGQPECLKEFFDELSKLEKEHGWMTIPDVFDRFGKEE